MVMTKARLRVIDEFAFFAGESKIACGRQFGGERRAKSFRYRPKVLHLRLIASAAHVSEIVDLCDVLPWLTLPASYGPNRKRYSA
jgi:hypothetical protein